MLDLVGISIQCCLKCIWQCA